MATTAPYPAPTAETVAHLDEIWHTPHTLYGRLATVDHKMIGIRYLVTAFVFLVLGGLEALLMRAQLARPNQHLLSPEAVQPALHDARHDDDLPGTPSPILSGLQQLSLAAPARLARHGVPAPQRVSATGSFLLLRIFLYSSFARRRRRRTTAGSPTCPMHGAFNTRRAEHGLLRAGHALPRRSRRRSASINFIVTMLQDARARHVDQPHADHGLEHAHDLGRRRCFALPSLSAARIFLLGFDRRFGDALLRQRAAAAARCSGSICSGCSGIRGSTSSCCPRWAWCR